MMLCGKMSECRDVDADEEIHMKRKIVFCFVSCMSIGARSKYTFTLAAVD